MTELSRLVGEPRTVSASQNRSVFEEEGIDAMSRRKTLEDVAKAAGVGKATVSYVLNGRAGKTRISDATSQRVLEAAEKLDYRPNAIARMLQNRHSDAVAVVFQYADYFRASSTFISELMRGVCDASISAGVDVLLHTKSATDPRTEGDALTDGRVDGALMLRDAQDPIFGLLKARNFPVVMFFSRSEDPDVPFVDTDNALGSNLAIDHLVALGHHRIGMLRGSIMSMASNDRYAGFLSALKKHNLPAIPEFVIGNDQHEQFVEIMRRPDRPTALFVWSDDVAFACIRTLAELGLSVPKDISIIGFDSTSACEQGSPQLTSVGQPIAEMASAATRMLVDLIHQRLPVDQHQLVFRPVLDVRGSTAPPRCIH